MAHNELYRPLIKSYMVRHKVKPGITGWAQVNGFRGETDSLEKMEGAHPLRPRLPAQLVAAAGSVHHLKTIRLVFRDTAAY